MGKVGWALLAGVVGFGALQGARNAAEHHAADDRAASLACDELSSCSWDERDPIELDAGPFQRTYMFETGRGDVRVSCRFEYLLFGSVECEGQIDKRALVDSRPRDRYPHEVQRGLRD